MPFMSPNQQCQSIEMKSYDILWRIFYWDNELLNAVQWSNHGSLSLSVLTAIFQVNLG